MDLTYVDNVVDSLILAASAGDHVIGKKYNITNGEHVPFYNFAIRKLCEAANIKFPTSHVPYNVVWYVAWTLETLYR